MMLKKVFDMDNPIMQGLAAAFDLMLLNILALIAALPVITAGASLVALFDMSRRLIRGEDVYISSAFFASFRQNLRNGIFIGLIFIPAAVLVVLNFHAASVYAPMLRYTSFATGLLILAAAIYTFALAAAFENNVRNTIVNAFKLMIAYFPRTLIMLVSVLAFYILSISFPQIGMPLLMLFGLSLPVYILSLIARPIIDSLQRDGDR